MKLLNCALVALALSGTGCGSESSVSPQVVQISGTVRYTNGAAVAGAPVDAVIGSNTIIPSTLSDPAGRFVIVVPATSETITLRASSPPPPPGSGISGAYYGFAHVGRTSLGLIVRRMTVDIVLDEYQPI